METNRKDLEKKDLVSLQIAFPEIGKILARIPDIWHHKHYKYYCDNFNFSESRNQVKEEIFDLFIQKLVEQIADYKK